MNETSELSYDALLQSGIKYLEDLATEDWTDFNAHDPGITILEQVCWALTDLAYRLDHPMEDILAEGGRSPETVMPAPAEALGCAPVTLDDLRRVILDVDGVEGVWIEADETPEPRLHYNFQRRSLSTSARVSETEELRLRGLWRVVIAGREDPDGGTGSLAARVAQRIHAQRPLCHDFSTIDVLAPAPILVDAEIEIEPVPDPESLLVDILTSLDQHISPRASFRTMPRDGAGAESLEDLFDGPTLLHGFLADAAGKPFPTELYASDLLRVVMDVPGVRTVRHIRMANRSFGSQDWEDWVLPLDGNRPPRLDPQPGHIRLFHNQIPVRTNTSRVLLRFRNLRAHATRRLPAPSEITPTIPTGRNRNIGHYLSILNEFPEAYGVSDIGLPPDATPLRRAQMKQLKAYLQLFDQLLADSFAQAANAADLLSGNGSARRAYRPGLIESEGLDLDSVRKDPAGYQYAVAARLEAIGTSPGGIALIRRQLDHLLARYGEAFVDPMPPVGADPGNRAEQEGWDGLADRRAFLSELALVTAARGSAADDLRPRDDDNRGGLERRIALKLGLRPEQGEDYFIVEHLLLRALDGDQIQTEPLLQEVPTPDPYSFQLSFVFPGSHGRFADAEPGETADGLPASFRGFAEHVIREETPAHLIPYVHWLDDKAFKAAQESFDLWRERRRDRLMERYNISEARPKP